MCGEEAVTNKAKPEQNRLRYLKRHLGQSVQLDDRTISYNDAITEVVQHCVRVANKRLEAGWMVSTNLISLSYPATYTFAQRQQLIELVEKATLEDGRKLKVYGTIAEPAAAALDYLAEFAKKDSDTTVLTYDLGGGTFDLGLVSVYPKGRQRRNGGIYYYDIINTSGIADLGGAEFDDAMYELVTKKISIPLDAQVKAILKNACETAKVELTDMEDTEIELFTEHGRINVNITRSEFEKASEHLIRKTVEATKQMLNSHQNQRPDIILLTGGASQMPMVMKELEKALPNYKGKIKTYKPSMSIAYGAARYGTEEKDNSAGTVVQRLNNDIGIKFYEKAESDVLYISAYLKAGTEIPCESVFMSSSTRAVQSSSTFNVYEANKPNPNEYNCETDYTHILKVNLSFGKEVLIGHECETKLVVDNRGVLTIHAREKENPSNIVQNQVVLMNLSTN